MSRWFRFYAKAIRDPKVARLTDAQFRLWVELLSVAADNEGVIPSKDDLKHLLKRRLDHLSRGVDDLLGAGLIDALADGYEPHNWSKFQYKSDTSTGRVTKHRTKRNVSQDVSETAPDTETDSVDKSTAGGAAIVDPEKVMFDTGIDYLASVGIPPAKSRPLLGKWKRDHGAARVIEAMGAAQRQGIMDPIAWIEARWNAANDTGQRIRQEAPC